MLSVSDRVADDLWAPNNQMDTLVKNLGEAHVLKEDLEDTTGFLVDETRYTLHTTTASKTANSLRQWVAFFRTSWYLHMI